MSETKPAPVSVPAGGAATEARLRVRGMDAGAGIFS